MNLYIQYLKESWGRSYKEWPWGFVVYEINPEGNNVHVWDNYIIPEARGNGHHEEITLFMENIAKEHGLKYITGEVFRHMEGAERSVVAHLKRGGKIVAMDSLKITIAKEIK